MALGFRAHEGECCFSKLESMRLADADDQAIVQFRLLLRITWHVGFLWIWRLLRGWRVFETDFSRNAAIEKVL